MKDIPNPWYEPRRTGSPQFFKVPDKPIATEQGIEFYALPASVLAVKRGKAITECVTVRGAKKHLATLGVLG